MSDPTAKILSPHEAIRVLRLVAEGDRHYAEQRAKGVTFPAHLTPDPGQSAKILTQVADSLEMVVNLYCRKWMEDPHA